MDPKHFHHALTISGELCIGCSHCMQVCPTEAIRIRNGKAILYENRCVDCSECYRACPVHAIFIDQDDYARIDSYKHKIALVPGVFFGQFSDDIPRDRIYQAIMSTGFTEVLEVELSVELLLSQMTEYIDSHKDQKPLISSFCPAIVRLIQVKFPSLTSHIMLVKPPLDITALFSRKKLVDQGVNPAEIGVFYITPCAAKIAAIKSPVGEEVSMITGVINMDTLYNKVTKYLRKDRSLPVPVKLSKVLTKKSVKWTLTHGESAQVKGRSLAVDEIHNVINFLEKIENNEIKDVDFLELRACDQSCAGGVLLTVNSFIIAEKLRKYSYKREEAIEDQKEIMAYEDYLKKRIHIQEVKPRSMMMLDEDMEEAMRKMEKASKMLQCLPLTDCGACGSPNCQAFAEDIALNQADIRQCIFIQKNREQTGELTPDESLEIMKSVWGESKFFKNKGQC